MHFSLPISDLLESLCSDGTWRRDIQHRRTGRSGETLRFDEMAIGARPGIAGGMELPLRAVG
ncbi:MAG: hypothetical protein K2W81_00390 [Sphingomonas sp.]|nr:hypothetical protein [Sphingomonas sp.]